MSSFLIILKIPPYYNPKVKIAKVGYSSMVECLICKALSSIPNTRKTTKLPTHHHQKREGIQKKKKKEFKRYSKISAVTGKSKTHRTKSYCSQTSHRRGDIELHLKGQGRGKKGGIPASGCTRGDRTVEKQGCEETLSAQNS